MQELIHLFKGDFMHAHTMKNVTNLGRIYIEHVLWAILVQ